MSDRHSSTAAVFEALEDRLLLSVTGTTSSHALSLALPSITWLNSGSVNGVIAKGTYTSHQHSEITDAQGTHISDSLAEPWTEGSDPGWQGNVLSLLAADSHNTAYTVNYGAGATGAQSSAFIDYVVSVHQIAPLPQGFPLSTFYIPIKSQFYLQAAVSGSVGLQYGTGTANAYVEVCLSNGAEYAKEEVDAGWPSDQGGTSNTKTATFSNMVAYSPATLGSDYICVHFTAAGDAQVATFLLANSTIDTTSSANVQEIYFDQAAFNAIWGAKSFTLSNYFQLVLGWDPAYPVPAGPGTFDLTGTMTPLVLSSPTSAGSFNLVQLQLSNSGTGPAAGFATMQLWASGDGVLGSGSDDYKLSEIRPYVYSPSHGSGLCFFSYFVPSNIPAGTYDLIAVIDSGNDIPETSHANNQVVRADAFVVQVPDLTGAVSNPLNPIILSNPTQGGAYQFVQLAFRNAGSVTASGFVTMQLWASLDGNLSSGTDDYKLSETRPYIYLPAGGTGYAFFSYTAPSNIPAGTYDLIAVIDSGNDITESNEGNNKVVVADRFVMQNPDLTGAVTTPLNPIIMNANVKRWDFNFVELRVRNAGAATAAGFVSMQLWASLDGNLAVGSDDYKLAEIRPYAYIPSGGTGYFYFAYLVPNTGIPNGTYDLIAVIDSSNDFLETNESNNQVVLADRFVLVNSGSVGSLAANAESQAALSSAAAPKADDSGVAAVPAIKIDAATGIPAPAVIADPVVVSVRPSDATLALAPVNAEDQPVAHYVAPVDTAESSDLSDPFQWVLPL